MTPTDVQQVIARVDALEALVKAQERLIDALKSNIAEKEQVIHALSAEDGYKKARASR